jgi:hypothetical protein
MIEQLLATQTSRLWSATLVGNAPPGVVKLREEMQNPRPGDYVLELSAMIRNILAKTIRESMGRLLGVRNEFVPFEEEEGGYYENYTYIEGFDGRLHRWWNCQFIKIIDNPYTYREVALTDHSEWVAEAIRRHGL